MTMIKPSKYLLTFFGIFVLLGLSLLASSQKFLPLFLQHTVYYCESFLQSFSIQIPQSFGAFLLGFLALLVSFTLIKFVATYIKVTLFRNKLNQKLHKHKQFDQIVQKLDLSRKAFLVNDDRLFAFCHGIRHPGIYLSSGLFSIVNVNELEAILLHEKHHLEHKDALILLVAELTQSLFPFFPILSDLIHNYRTDRELSADHEVIQKMNDPAPLISILKKLLVAEPIPQFVLAPALADHETLEVRIKALTKKEIRFIKFGLLNVLVSVISIGVFVILTIAPVQAIEMHQHDSDVMMVCLQNDKCATWCKENQSVTPFSKAPNASYPHTPAIPMSPAQ